MKHLIFALSMAFPAMGLALPVATHAALPQPPAILQWKSTIAGWNDSYYWYDTDGARYAFTSQAAYQSWFPGTPTGVSQATVPELAPVKLNGAVFHNPGERLIKFASSPNIYAVSRYGILRWIATEQVAMDLYGVQWTSYVDELSVTEYPLYHFGSPITDSAEYDRAAYWNVTNPSSNAVNATNRPPEKFDAKVSLAIDRSDAFVGSTFKLSATVTETREAWNTVTIRFYDHQQQVVGVCRGTVACSVDVIATGPVGAQTFTARAFNAWEQSVEATPVNINIANKQ